MAGLIPTRVTAAYEQYLQSIYHRISYRGLLVDKTELAILDNEVCSQIVTLCSELTNSWGQLVYLGNMKETFDGKSKENGINLNSPDQVIAALKVRGFKVPKSRKKLDDDGNALESADQLALIKLFARTGDSNLERILNVSKFKTVLTRYVRAELWNDLYLCQYSVAATLSGRRGSKKHLFGVGNNAQNWPKYSDFGKKFRGCIRARPGKIFFSVDQKQAEDYPVSALSENHSALDQLIHGVDRHKKTAAFLFSLPEDQVKKYPHRFLGKKTRHANNYGMWKNTMSDSLAKEGLPMTPDECAYLLKKMDEFEPSIKAIFHAYIEKCLSDSRTLVTPLGRERVFFGLRPRGDNSRIFMEAYSYIPQSSVGDNTGFAMVYLDSMGWFIVHECHDSITLEIDDNWETINRARIDFAKAFNRKLRFHNGIEVEIPVEGELGYNLRDTFSTEKAKELLGVGKAENDLREDVVLKMYEEIQKQRPQNHFPQIIIPGTDMDTVSNLPDNGLHNEAASRIMA